MKIKKVIGIILGILLIVIVVVAINIPKPQHVSDDSFNLMTLDDGIYQGKFDNGLVSVEVEVEVQNHTIANINLVKHQNGMGQAAESVIIDVIDSQSLEVDTVSGATLSSQTILKAIENALCE